MRQIKILSKSRRLMKSMLNSKLQQLKKKPTPGRKGSIGIQLPFGLMLQ